MVHEIGSSLGKKVYLLNQILDCLWFQLEPEFGFICRILWFFFGFNVTIVLKKLDFYPKNKYTFDKNEQKIDWCGTLVPQVPHVEILINTGFFESRKNKCGTFQNLVPHRKPLYLQGKKGIVALVALNFI